MVNIGSSSLTFNRSKTKKLSHNNFYSCDIGAIVPDAIIPVYPGDSFHITPTDLTRMATPIAPLLSSLYEDRYIFFVPNRLIWSHWEQFLGADDVLTGEQHDYKIPFSTSKTVGSNEAITGGRPNSDNVPEYLHTLADYMRVRGIPNINGGGSSWFKNTIIPSVNELPLRAYYKIYNDWFRDANIEAPILFSIEDDANTSISYADKPLQAYKLHDIFTDSLTSPQMGDSVVLSLGDSADIISTLDLVPGSSGFSRVDLFHNGTAGFKTNLNADYLSGGRVVLGDGNDAVSVSSAEIIPGLDTSKLKADLTTATMLSINELRFAIAMQQYKERDAIGGGNRYYTWLLAHFGVRSSDARLQRSELILASSTPLHMQQVASSAETESAPVGYTGAFSLTVSNSNSGWHHFTEHGFIISIKVIRPENIYPQALPDFYNYSTKYDFYDPLFAHLGMVDVPSYCVSLRKNDVITQYGVSKIKDDSTTFGYFEYGWSMRQMLSSCSGYLNPQNSNSLDYWLVAPRDDTDVADSLTLSSTFLKVSENILDNALVQGSTSCDFVCSVHFDIEAVRVMPLHSTPGLNRI